MTTDKLRIIIEKVVLKNVAPLFDIIFPKNLLFRASMASNESNYILQEIMFSALGITA